MQIPVQQFPILTPGQMNPYNQALSQGLETYMNLVKAQYEPLRIKSEAASKLAYSQLMGPQFMAKLLGNEHILANTPNPQEKVNSLYGAVQNAGNISNGTQGGGGLLDSLSNWYHNRVKGGSSSGSEAGAPQQFSPPASSNVIPGQQGTEYPGSSSDASTYDKNGNNIVATPNQVNESLRPNQPVAATSDVGKATQAWIDSPEGKALAQRQGYVSLPDDKALMDWYKAKQRPDTAKTFAENVGAYKGNVEEGKELGTQRAKDIADFGDQIETGYQLDTPFKQLSGLITSPTWQNMRNSIPFFQDKQLNILSKIGNKEQKQMIGQFITSSQEVVRQTINSFKGTRMKGELIISQQMKINDNDTYDVAIGKLTAAKTFKEFNTQRASMASQLMLNRHMNKADALQTADKMLDGNAIRNKIDHEMNPKPTQDDIDHMVEKYKKPEAEIRRMLKQKGLL